MSDYLPEEIMVKIFEQLPTKSLIRFTCLSKQWNYLILSNTQFAKSQFQIASQRQTLTRRLLFQSSITGFKSPNLEVPGVARDLRRQFNSVKFAVQEICSSNGLVCAGLDKCICIWNPSTGLYREFPLPELHTPYSNYRVDSFGFGYVSATDDYKVFANTMLDIRILSLRGNIWKKIEAYHPYLENIYGLGACTHLNGALHWCEDNDRNILAFDLYQEEFLTMPMPPLPSGIFPYIQATGVSLGGCLSLLTKINSADTSANLWIMREYGVADSWTIHCTLKIRSEINNFRLFTYMEKDNSVLMLTSEYPMYKLIRSSPHEEDEIRIWAVGSGFALIEYQETLLWLS